MALKNSTKKILKKILYYLGVLALVVFIFCVLLFLYYWRQLPEISALSVIRVGESTKIYDKTGKVLLFDIHGEEKRTIIPWEKIPESVRESTIAIEDNSFYDHSGIDIRGIFRALYKDISQGGLNQGGSTITQQLVKNTLFGQEKKISRKIKEVIFSIQIEKSISKDEILWMYLNQIPYGSNIYGIEEASQGYLGKPANELSNAEAALLAAMIQAPSYYSPYGNNIEGLLSRKNLVLKKMQDLNFITQEEYDTAIAEQIAIEPPSNGIKAGHFVIMVRNYLVNKYGEDAVENGGLKIITTLDYDLQQIAEDAVKKYGEINAKNYKANNMALVSSDPKTGKILAMVGSRNYLGKSEPEGCTPGVNCKFDPQVNVALRNRQPGSSFKPFAYATAFDKGFSDSTILFDLQTEFNPSCDSSGTGTKDKYGLDCYNPRNYLGNFSGPVSMRQALARSLNIPAVKTLYLAGISDTIKTATNMGITTLNKPDNYGLALVLGGAEVKLLDMVSAYGVFANDGISEGSSFIESVTTSSGKILEQYEKSEKRVLDTQVARMISDVLSDNNARAPIFGFNSPLHMKDRPVAAKTGTTQNNRDGWIMGYTPSLVTGVWVGNNDNSPMTASGAGTSGAGPAWNEFMTKALSGTPVEEFIKPEPNPSSKTMLNGTIYGPSGVHSILFYVDPNNPVGPEPSNPYSDPQFVNWEVPVQKWIGSIQPQSTQNPPTQTDPNATPVPVTF